MKSNIIQMKNVHFFNTINKVENINILLKIQFGHTILIYASIRDILTSSYKRPIEKGILFVEDNIKLDSIGQHIVPYSKADSGSSSKQKLLRSNYKGVSEWIDVKS